MSGKLKACKCGAEAEGVADSDPYGFLYHWIQCTQCREQTQDYGDKQLAIDAWNSRPEQKEEGENG